MNARVLELLKNPELFQSQDLELLAVEIKKQPYIQNIRALQLYGIHRFSPEEYQNALSTTAAYTTDKKILYQFINSAAAEKSAPTDNSEIIARKEPVKKVFAQVEAVQREAPKPVYVDGALNRILFEGEEDFLTRQNEIIDLESTMESGQIVTHLSEGETTETVKTEEKISIPERIQNTGDNDLHGDDQTYETDHSLPIPLQIVDENETPQPKPEVITEEEKQLVSEVAENPADINFHGTQEFLSEVKIVPKMVEPAAYKVPQPQLNKHEIEMQRLIAEVEAKMKSAKKPKKEEKEEEIQNTGLNFSETQSFEPGPEETSVEDKPRESKGRFTAEETGEITHKQIHTESIQKEDSTSLEHQAWKPMSFAGNTPDALIGREKVTGETKAAPAEDENQHPESVPEITLDDKTEERPVFNVSFFTQKVSPIESEPVEQKAPAEQEDEKEAEAAVKSQESNVPTFINTWQNWLKIDRSGTDAGQKITPSKTEVKNTVIENFIVKEPKISKLREESDFVVKERGDNISHLMTETLAKLYVEQKLYTKAIKAYQILSEKHPEKKPHFDEQISNIRELRQNK